MKVLIANQHEVTQLLPMSECIEVISDALTVSADHRQARITLDAIELIRKELGVNMNLGASNVSFGLPDRKIINVAYLALAISRGLTTAITDPTVPEIQTTLLACDLLMGRDEYSARWIKAFRAKPNAKKPKPKRHSKRCMNAIAMAEAVAGGENALSAKPFIACYINVTSGLVHNEEALKKVLFLAEKGIPALYLPLVTAGMTGPVALPGSMAMLNAGALVGVVLSQLKREGAPVIVPGCGLTIIDMRTMVNPYCSPDGKGITHAMSRYYSLPNFALGGGAESKLVDGQTAAEAALTLMSETLNGGNLIHDLGYLESGLSGSLAQLAICDEIVGWLKHYVAPVEVNAETLMLNLIDEKGPEGSFITHEHTLKHFREHWYPRLFERGNYSQWEKAGCKSLGERASEQVEKILAGGVKNPLPEDVVHSLKNIVQKAVQ
jgi:hypothetical protein